jgi:hypothetical protein
MRRPDRYSLNDWDRGLGDGHDDEEVSFYLCAEVGDAGIFDRVDIAVARVVDENVEPPEDLDNHLDGHALRVHRSRRGRRPEPDRRIFPPDRRAARVARRGGRAGALRQAPFRRGLRLSRGNYRDHPIWHGNLLRQLWIVYKQD